VVGYSGKPKNVRLKGSAYDFSKNGASQADILIIAMGTWLVSADDSRAGDRQDNQSHWPETKGAECQAAGAMLGCFGEVHLKHADRTGQKEI